MSSYSKPNQEELVVLEIINDYVFEPPREFTLKEFKQEAFGRGLKSSNTLDNLIHGRLIELEGEGLIKRVGEGDRAKYTPKSLIKKKKK